MDEQLYTVARKDGDNREYGLTLREAAEAILGHDGHQWQILSEMGGGHCLWTSPVSRNSPAWRGMTKSSVFSAETDIEAATDDIYRKVIARSAEWDGLVAQTQDGFEEEIETLLGEAVESGDKDQENYCRMILEDARGTFPDMPSVSI